MTDVSISLDLKQQLIDFYEESKKTIDNHLLILSNEMKKIKIQHELLYKKAMEILLKTENEEIIFKNNLTRSDFGSNSDSPLRKKAKTPLKGKSSNLLKNYKLQGDLALNLKKTKIEKKKNFKITKNKLPTHKNKNINNTSFSSKNTNMIINNNPNSLKSTKTKFPQKIQKVVKKNSLNSNNSGTSINEHNSASSFHYQPSLNNEIHSNKNKMKNENKLVNKKKKINKPIFNNIINKDIRKFSIIDIPAINSIQEKSKKNNENNYNEKSSHSFESEDSNSFVLGINDENEYFLNKTILSKIKSTKEKCFYLVSKSDLVPLKIRLIFSKRIRSVYNYNPPSKILNDYLELLDKNIKDLKNKDLNKFNPSLTAQCSLCFIQKEDESSILNLKLVNEDSKNKISCLIKLILLIAGREYSNDINYEFLIQELKKISNCQIRKFLINIETLKNIEQLSEKIINSFIEISESNKDIFILNNDDIPKSYEKIMFYLKEIYDFLKTKSNNYKKKNKFKEERNHFQQKLVYNKIKS